jgi:hypothetical protein
MKRIFPVIAFSIICSAAAFGEDLQGLLKSFTEINNAFNGPSALLMRQRLVRMTGDNAILDESDAYSLYNNGRQIVKIKEKNSDIYFLSTENGYWIKNKNLRTPLKISGNYTVEHIEIQDIFHIDIETDYTVLNIEDETKSLVLERTNNRMVYPFIKMRTLGDSTKDNARYELLFLDRNKKPVCKVIYEAGYADGYYCFKTITVYNLLFDVKTFGRYITDSINRAQIPLSLFRETQMNQLISYFENTLR